MNLTYFLKGPVDHMDTINITIEILAYLAQVLTYAFSTVLIVFTFLFVLALLIKHHNAGNRFKSALIKILEGKSFDPVEKGKQAELLYNDYCGVFFNNIKPISLSALLSELTADLGNGDYEKYYNITISSPSIIIDRIATLDNYIAEKNQFNYEKDIESIRESIFNLESDNSHRKILDLWNSVFGKLTTCNAFYNGRIFQLENNIDTLNKKLRIKTIGKFFAWIGWILGVLSSIITISGIFK